MVAPTMPRKEHNTSNNGHSNGNNNNYNTCNTQ